MSVERTSDPARSRGWVLVALTVAVLACFVTKGFTIDDPLFLWLGEHLRADPLDFYGFDVLWTGRWQPMHEVTQNPPLTGYYIAAVSSLVGTSEVALHAAFLVPAAFAAAGIHALARRFTRSPLRAGMIAVLSPVFLVSSTNVMSDTSMLAFYCWALYLWVRGVDEERFRDLSIASVLAGLGLLTKYFAISLVPLFAVYALAKRRSFARWPLALLPALAIAAAYEVAAHALYGHGLLLGAAGYATSFRDEEEVRILQQGLVGLVFAGGCVVAPLSFAIRLWSWKGLVPIALFGALVAFVASGGLPAVTGAGWTPETLGTSVQLGAFAASGAALFLLAGGELRRSRGPDEWLLCLWAAGTFVFAAFVNWVDNGRSNLPLAPVAALLIARRLDAGGTGARESDARASDSLLGYGLCLAPVALLALVAAYADFAWANRVRAAARELAATYVPRVPAVRFTGTWGFQYYMQRAGAHGVDAEGEIMRAGELLVIPNNNNKIDLQGVGEPYVELLARRVDANPLPVWTMSWENRAGFYASNYGPLPYSFGSAVSDFYEIWRVKQGFQVQALGDE